MSKVKKENNTDNKTKMYIVFISVAVLVVVSVITFIWRGTFAATDNRLLFNCSVNDITSGTFTCDLVLSSSEGSINGIKANYSFSEGLSYVGFESPMDCENSNQCIVETTENGFVVGDINGFSANENIGTLTVALPTELPEGARYTVTLTQIDLSTSEFDSISVNDLTATISVGYNPPPSEDVSFDDSLEVDNSYRLIERLDLKPRSDSTTNYTYDDILDKIETTGTIYVVDKNDQPVANNSSLRTGDVIKIETSGSTYSYTVSVLGDLNGDSEIDIFDVTKLYQYIKNVRQITDPVELSAANIADDGEYDIWDVTVLYRYIKDIRKTLKGGAA